MAGTSSGADGAPPRAADARRTARPVSAAGGVWAGAVGDPPATSGPVRDELAPLTDATAGIATEAGVAVPGSPASGTAGGGDGAGAAVSGSAASAIAGGAAGSNTGSDGSRTGSTGAGSGGGGLSTDAGSATTTGTATAGGGACSGTAAPPCSAFGGSPSTTPGRGVGSAPPTAFDRSGRSPSGST